MKKKFSFLLIFALILSMAMTGCKSQPETEEIEEIIEVVVSSTTEDTEQNQNSTRSTTSVTNNNSSQTQPQSQVQTQTPTVSNTSSQVQKPTGPNVPVLNCGYPTVENALSWAQTYGKEMSWGKDYSVDSDLMVAHIRPLSLYDTYSLKRKFEFNGDYPGDRGTHAYVDFGQNEIGIKNPKNPKEKLTFKTCSFQFVARREYIVEHAVIGGRFISFTITDTVENKKDTIIYDDDTESYFARSAGVRTDEYSESYVEVLSRKVYSLQPYNPQVLILGDSFVSDYYEHRYATHISNKLNGSAFINGISGGTTSGFIKALRNLPEICQPKYVVLAIGTNHNDFESWKTDMEKILTTIKNDFNGATPIFVTVTLRSNKSENGNLAFATQANDWIRNSGYKYVDANKLTSVNGDMKTQDLGKFQGDKVHPSPSGHQAIYNGFLTSVPELFN